ncbi:MAG: potassium channel family protein [Anaerolineales bacterium]|jgi:voltage-gated potassium channel
MAQNRGATLEHSNAYNIFIFVLTVLSLAIMVVMLLPISASTYTLLQVYENLICIIFLADFFRNLRGSSPKSTYFINERGWLDLLGSIPSIGLAFKYSGLLRLARLSRLARITRLMRGNNKEALVKDIVENRSQYTVFVTILSTILVLTVSSVLVLQFESQSPKASIQTGGDSLWYSLVTITTVGYGDFYPVTTGGRITAFFIMIMGVGIIGVLASLLSSLLVGSPAAADEEENPEIAVQPAVERELAEIKNELSVLRQMLENLAANSEKK